MTVSIHARAWRATLRIRRTVIWRWFQFTPARGGRLSDMVLWRMNLLFQFTPARGGRRLIDLAMVAINRFNSRPRVAGDVFIFDDPFLGVDVSIHARAWRATVVKLAPIVFCDVSIHARAWRATNSLQDTISEY